MSGSSASSGAAPDPTATFEAGLAKAKAYVAALRELGDPPVDLLTAHPVFGAGFVFYKTPSVQAQSGFQIGTFEILSLLHGICLAEASKGSSLLTDKMGYPLIGIDEDKEFTSPAGPEETNVRAVDLDGGDPEVTRALIMSYVRAVLKDDIGIAESDTVLCNKYFQFEKLVGGRATRTANFKVWSFTMFQALRLMTLSPPGVGDEQQRPLYTLKREFNGTVAAVEKRLTSHFTQGIQAVSNAPSANKTAAGVTQALILAGSLGTSIRNGFLQPQAQTAGSTGSDEQPPSKKQRMSVLLGARSSNPPARVSDTKAGIVGPKLLRAVTWPFKRVTLVEIHRELEAAGDSTSRVEEVSDGVFINLGKDTRTKLDSVAKLRTAITAVGTSLATICPTFSPHTVSYGWTVLFRATFDRYSKVSVSTPNRLKALEFYVQDTWFAVQAYLTEAADDDKDARAAARPVYFGSDADLWADCVLRASTFVDHHDTGGRGFSGGGSGVGPSNHGGGNRSRPTIKSQPGCDGGRKNDVSPNVTVRKATDKTREQDCKKFEAGLPCAYTDGKGRCPFKHPSADGKKKVSFNKFVEVSADN